MKDKTDIYYNPSFKDELTVLKMAFGHGGTDVERAAKMYRNGQLKKSLDKYSTPEQRANYKKAIRILDRITSSDGRILSSDELLINEQLDEAFNALHIAMKR